MDLQCCQCHDHPLIDDYYQEDYYGLFAFVHRTSLFTDAKSKQVQLTEKADGEASYKSVFTGDSSDKALPQLPKGAVLFVEPTFAKGEEYAVKPDKTVRGVPKFSRRAALAEMVAEQPRVPPQPGQSPVGRRCLAAASSIRSISTTPPIRRLIRRCSRCWPTSWPPAAFNCGRCSRELALTRAYQRSCDAPRPEIVNFADIAARLERLNARQGSRGKPPCSR